MTQDTCALPIYGEYWLDLIALVWYAESKVAFLWIHLSLPQGAMQQRGDIQAQYTVVGSRRYAQKTANYGLDGLEMAQKTK